MKARIASLDIHTHIYIYRIYEQCNFETQSNEVYANVYHTIFYFKIFAQTFPPVI